MKLEATTGPAGQHLHQQKEEKETEGFRTAKALVTLLVTCNMNEHQMDLLLIRKSKSPRSFKNVKEFPMQYDFSANAWLTEKIFEK